PGSEAQACAGTTGQRAPIATGPVQAVPLDRPVLSAQPWRHLQLGLAGAAAPGRAGRSPPGALLACRNRGQSGRLSPEPGTTSAGRPENHRPASTGCCSLAAGSVATEQGQP